jgi:NAD-dependent SIR2 family protein deacetylase
VPSSIPAVAGLLPELWNRARKLGRDEIDRLASWCDDHNVTNIEELLTAAYLANFTARNSNITGLIEYFLFRHADSDSGEERRAPERARLSKVDASSVALFQETLQGLFGLLTGLMLPAGPNPAHDAIVALLKHHAHTSLVTTNYDGCIDEALLRNSVRFRSYIEPIAKDPSREGAPPLDLVKIHGSINWSYCESCHEVKSFDLMTMKTTFLEDVASYAVVGICKNCGGQRRPLLIPPLALKFIMFPSLIRLWDRARENLERADIILVVGYSFSDADTYLNKIIEKSMSFNAKQRVIVCDLSANVVQKLRRQYAARISGFQPERILAAFGSAEKVLPEILEILGPPSSKSDRPSKKTAGAGEAEEKNAPAK